MYIPGSFLRFYRPNPAFGLRDLRTGLGEGPRTPDPGAAKISSPRSLCLERPNTEVTETLRGLCDEAL